MGSKKSMKELDYPPNFWGRVYWDFLDFPKKIWGRWPLPLWGPGPPIPPKQLKSRPWAPYRGVGPQTPKMFWEV